MRDRNGRSSRLLSTIEKRKARIIRIYESVVSIIVLMLWIVDVRSKVDVILFLKPISELICSKVRICYRDVEIHYSPIVRGNLNLKL